MPMGLQQWLSLCRPFNSAVSVDQSVLARHGDARHGGGMKAFVDAKRGIEDDFENSFGCVSFTWGVKRGCFRCRGCAALGHALAFRGWRASRVRSACRWPWQQAENVARSIDARRRSRGELLGRLCVGSRPLINFRTRAYDSREGGEVHIRLDSVYVCACKFLRAKSPAHFRPEC